MNSQKIIQDLPAWQEMLTNHYQTFATINSGARIGLMARQDFDRLEGTVLVWQVMPDQAVATSTEFTGFRTSGIDLLFVLDDESLAKLHLSAINGKAINKFEEELRQGGILFYAIKSKPELLGLGYEEFLEAIGLPFLGGCQ